MHIFDYSFLDNGMLPAGLVNLTASISELKTMAGVRKEDNAKIFSELESIARVQSIKSSNAIEGIVTSDERIAAIVNGESEPLNHSEIEIAGYRDALNAVHLNHETLDFREKDGIITAIEYCNERIEAQLSSVSRGVRLARPLPGRKGPLPKLGRCTSLLGKRRTSV